MQPAQQPIETGIPGAGHAAALARRGAHPGAIDARASRPCAGAGGAWASAVAGELTSRPLSGATSACARRPVADGGADSEIGGGSGGGGGARLGRFRRDFIERIGMLASIATCRVLLLEIHVAIRRVDFDVFRDHRDQVGLERLDDVGREREMIREQYQAQALACAVALGCFGLKAIF